jgi:hypothetical protein
MANPTFNQVFLGSFGGNPADPVIQDGVVTILTNTDALPQVADSIYADPRAYLKALLESARLGLASAIPAISRCTIIKSSVVQGNAINTTYTVTFVSPVDNSKAIANEP